MGDANRSACEMSRRVSNKLLTQQRVKGSAVWCVGVIVRGSGGVGGELEGEAAV